MKKNSIVLHHSLTDRDTTKAKSINNFHANKLGWGRIGYHFVIEGNGNIVDCSIYGTTINKDGYHCTQKSMNKTSIGICITGNFDKQEPSKAQLNSLKTLVNKLCKKYLITKDKVYFHREFATYKSCPGNKLNKEEIINFIFMENTDEPEIVTWAKENNIAQKWDKPYDQNKIIMAYMLRNHINNHHNDTK